jgi:fatty-acid desaturase
MPKWMEYVLTICGARLRGRHRSGGILRSLGDDLFSCGAFVFLRSWAFTLLTFGEGWHDKHHAHPQSSRHLAWYEFDPNWYGISALRVVGLACDVKARKPKTTIKASSRL